MPVKKRREMFDLGSLAATANTAWLDMGAFESMVIYGDCGGTGTSILGHASPDGGTTVANITGTLTSFSANEIKTITVSPCPGYVRINNPGAAAMDGVWIEGIRSIG